MRPAVRRAPGVRLMLILGLVAPPAPVLAGGTTAGLLWVRTAEPSPADTERARELYQNGVALFEEGSYEGAALAFERAYELSDDSNLLFNIALAYDRNGDFERAIEVLDRYRALAPESERTNLERRKQSLVRRLEKQRERPEPAPAEPPAPPDGEAAPAEDPLEAPAALAAATNAEPEDPSDAAPAEAEPTPRRFPISGWILASTAAASFGLGIGFGVSALRNNRRGRQGCAGAGETPLCRSSSGELLRTGRTRALIADVSFGVGAAAAVGVIIVAVTARGRTPQTALAPLITPDGGGLAMQRRF